MGIGLRVILLLEVLGSASGSALWGIAMLLGFAASPGCKGEIPYKFCPPYGIIRRRGARVPLGLAYEFFRLALISDPCFSSRATAL